MNEEMLKSGLQRKVGLLLKQGVLELYKSHFAFELKSSYEKTFDINAEFENLRDNFCDLGDITEMISLYSDVVKDKDKTRIIAADIFSQTHEEYKELIEKNEKNCSICEFMYKDVRGKNLSIDSISNNNKWCSIYPELPGMHNSEAIKKCQIFRSYVPIPKDTDKKLLLEILDKTYFSYVSANLK